VPPHSTKPTRSRVFMHATIRKLANAATTLGIALLLLIGVTLLRSEMEVREARTRNAAADGILRHIEELRAFVFQTILRYEEGPEASVPAAHADFGPLLRDRDFHVPEELRLLKRMRGNMQALDGLDQTLAAQTLVPGDAASPDAAGRERGATIVESLLASMVTMHDDAISLADVSERDIASAEKRVRNSVLALAALIAVLMLGSWRLVLDHIVAPIPALKRGIRAVAAGNLHHRIAPDQHNEISEVSKTFDQMTERLEDVYRSRESESDERTHLTLDSAMDAFVAMDSAGLIVEWNRQASAIFGWTRSEALGRPLADTIIPPQHRESHARGLARLLATGEEPTIDTRVGIMAMRRDGREFPVEIQITSIAVAGGKILGAFVRDISERVVNERAARQAESGLRRAQEVARLAHVVTTPDGTFESVSKNLSSLIGSPARMPGTARAWMGLIHPDDRASFRGAAAASASSGKTSVVEYRLVLGDGAVVHVRHVMEPIDAAAGAPGIRWFSTIQDVTDRARSAEALRASEARYRMLFDGSPLPLWVFDAKTLRFLAVNDAACREYGYARDEFLAMTLREIRPKEDIALVERVIDDWAGVAFGSGIWRHRRKDGTVISAEISSHEMLYGGVRARFVCATDVTQRLGAQAALRESEEKLRLLLDSTSEAIYGVDLGGGCTFANPACVEMLGYSCAEELLGRNMHALIHHTRADGRPLEREDCRIYRAFHQAAGTHVDDELFWRSDGTSFPVDYWSYPILRAGEVIGCVVAFSDITVRKLAQGEILRLNSDLERRVAGRTAELEAANKELEAFDYSISHDLRAPLNRIRGFGTALLEDFGERLGPQGRDFAQRICNAGERMDQLVGDLLRISTVSHDEINRSDVDMSALASSVFEALERADPGREVELVRPDGLIARADPGLLRIVLENLIGNAWKFTSRRARARIEFGVLPRQDAQVMFVRDNGAGFDGAAATNLFAPFRRLHAEGEFEGTGIGLATVQRIVRRHGGRVWAEAAVGCGATFYFTLSSSPPP
jgi:PAS domain S-box-containing protein